MPTQIFKENSNLKSIFGEYVLVLRYLNTLVCNGFFKNFPCSVVKILPMVEIDV